MIRCFWVEYLKEGTIYWKGNWRGASLREGEDHEFGFEHNEFRVPLKYLVSDFE